MLKSKVHMTLLIRNAEIYDGGGSKPIYGDIFISGDRISAIGKIPARHARETIDAQGIKVCPGFIDAFSKTDHYCGILDEPEQKEFLRNGITTVIGGQQGISLAPLFPGNWDLIEEWAGRHRNLGWHSVREFLERLSRLPLGVNFGTLIGYETVRRAFPISKKNLTKADAAFLDRIIRTALAEGGLGVSRQDQNNPIVPLLRQIIPARDLPAGFEPKTVVVVQAPGHDPLVGSTLYELSQFFRTRDPRAAVARLLSLTGRRALVSFPAMTPEKLRQVLIRPDILLGTAGASFSEGRRPKLIFADENVSALSYFLSLAAAEGLMSLPAAVQKITATPARALGLKNRGELKEGKFADIVGFSLDSRSYEISVKFVILNGKPVMRDGKFMGSAGRILLPV